MEQVQVNIEHKMRQIGDNYSKFQKVKHDVDCDQVEQIEADL